MGTRAEAIDKIRELEEEWRDHPELMHKEVAAPPGKTFVVADYASIEARVLLWLVGAEQLQVYPDRTGRMLTPMPSGLIRPKWDTQVVRCGSYSEQLIASVTCKKCGESRGGE